MTLYIATSNPGKLRDFALAAATHALLPLPGLASIPTPPEDETTFTANARAKALYYAAYALNHIVLADDSGLEVDALDGAPGVRSARYAEDLGFTGAAGLNPDARNNTCLLHALTHTAPEARQARYRCALAAARDGAILAESEGAVEGFILPEPRGESGFGYDPLFFLPACKHTMAELDSATRLSLSHRGAALRLLLPRLACL